MKNFFELVLAQSPHEYESGVASQVAGTCSSPIGSLKELISCVIEMVISPLVALLIGLAVLVFLWGIVTYVRNLDNETKRSEGRMMMVWGIIALFVMVSVWGLVGILTGTFNFGTTEPTPPQFNIGR